MNVLLTGATGFVGARLRSTLARRHHVFAITRDAAADDEPDVTWVQADLTRRDWCRELPAGVDAIVYAAQSRAYRDFPLGARDVLDVNVAGLTSLLETSATSGALRVIYLSSANVYGRAQRPLSEDDPIEPDSFYARSKRMAEMVLESYEGLLEGVVLRLFTVYGEGQRGMLVPSLLERLVRSQPIRIGRDGGLLLSPLYVDDACRAVAELLERPNPGRGFDIFNLGGSEVVSIQALATLMGQIASIDPRFEVVPTEPPNGWVANTERLELEIGRFGRTLLADGLARTVASYIESAAPGMATEPTQR